MDGALHKFAIYIKGVNGMDHIIVSSKPSHQYLLLRGQTWFWVHWNLFLLSCTCIAIFLINYRFWQREADISNEFTEFSKSWYLRYGLSLVMLFYKRKSIFSVNLYGFLNPIITVCFVFYPYIKRSLASLTFYLILLALCIRT